MAHNFWFSYQQPPGGGSTSSNIKPPLTDEEKQRERQINETREKEHQKHLAIDEAISKREAREVHKLDVELLSQRRAQEKERKAKAFVKHQKQSVAFDEQRPPLKSSDSKLRTSTSTEQSSSDLEGPQSSQDSKLKSPSPQPGSIDATTPTNPVLTLTSSTKGQFDVNRPRDESTESDQSIPRSQSQAEMLHKLSCRAPIASLDCMEEFSGTGGHLDFGRSISLGSNPILPIRNCSSTTPGLRYKNLGKSGLRVSNVGLGTWSIFTPNVSEEQAETIIKLAMDSGINLFDLSEAHSGTRAEIELGKIIERHSWKRSSFVVTTKIYWSTKSDERGLSRKHIIESVQASLQRLQLSYIDIVIVHKSDSMCPMEEIVRAMTYVINQGWAMYWGTARWSPVEIMEAYTNCRQFNCITPIMEQAEYHMFYREKAELYLPELYNKIGVGLMAWGPLSMYLGESQNGERILFPKGSFKATKSHSYSWTEDEVNKEIEDGRRHVDRVRELGTLAEKLGCTPVQLSIAWSLKHEPVQCLLLGATNPEQLHQSLQALQLLPRLSSAVMLEIERIIENKPIRPPPISTLAMR